MRKIALYISGEMDTFDWFNFYLLYECVCENVYVWQWEIEFEILFSYFFQTYLLIFFSVFFFFY